MRGSNKQPEHGNNGLADLMARLRALPDDPDTFPERIEMCRQALKSVRREERPAQWGWLHAEIGFCSMAIPSDDPDEGLRQAVEHYENALEIYTPDAYFKEWLGAARNLAIAYKRWKGGDRAKSLERAIQLQGRILQVCTRKKLPKAEAQAHSELAYLYLQRIEGDKAHNLEMAITHYQQTLEVWKRGAFPVRWAKVQYNLGTALFHLQRLGENREAHQEQAVRHFEQALEVLTQEAFPKEWAEVQHNLALAYIDRRKGDRAGNLERAVELLDTVLQVCQRENLPVEWAKAQNALGLAYFQSIRGGRSETLERAIGHFQKALEVQEEAGPAEQKALTQHNLSAAYIDRLLGDRIENLRQAVTYDQAALDTINQCEHTLSDWAMIKTGLAGALWRLATDLEQQKNHPQAAVHLEKAVEHGEEVVSVLGTRPLPYRRAFACYNLANIYSDRIEGDRARNQDRAIRYYEQALEFFTSKNFPDRWANAHSDLGITYLERGQTDSAEKAIEHFDKALEVFEPDTFPISTLRVARNLGNLLFEGRHWQDAVAPYQQALEATERLYQSSLLRVSKEAELGEAADLYRRTAYVLARDGDLEGAVVAVERGRARLLSETLQREHADLEALKDAHPNLYQRYQQVISEIADLTQRELRPETSSPTADPAAEMQDAHHRLDQVVEDIRQIPNYEALLVPPEFDDVAEAVQIDVPLVYVVVAPAGGLALIVHHGGIEKIWLNHLTDTALLGRVQRWLAFYAVNLGAGRAYEQAGNMMDRLKVSERERKAALEPLVSAQKAWFNILDDTTCWLGDVLMGSLVAALRELGYRRATLIPTSLLAFLPLHAARCLNEKGASRRYALDDVAFAYTPAARTLTYARRAAATIRGEDLFAADNPDGSLRYSAQEVNAVASHFDKPWLVRGTQATRNTALAAIPTCDVYHFSCHGDNAWREPLASTLWMTYRQRLTVRDLLAMPREHKARLAFLSACETGLIGTALPDEVVGLASGFMQAGVAGVVSTLWSVEERSTALLVERFYENWKKRQKEPLQALVEAQKWLRDEADGGCWSHPYHWAGFTLTGV